MEVEFKRINLKFTNGQCFSELRSPGISEQRSLDTISGTLDSIHQSVVSTIKEETTNLEELEKKVEENTKELERLRNIVEIRRYFKRIKTS